MRRPSSGFQAAELPPSRAPGITMSHSSMKTFRTPTEQQVGRNIERIFTNCPDSIELKLENFPKYVRRQHLKRFLAFYEILSASCPSRVQSWSAGYSVVLGSWRGPSSALSSNRK